MTRGKQMFPFDPINPYVNVTFFMLRPPPPPLSLFRQTINKNSKEAWLTKKTKEEEELMFSATPGEIFDPSQKTALLHET